MFAVSNNPRPNSYDLQQWYYLQQQQQQQAYQEQLQQQGFVKKKGCNCSKKKNIIKQYEE
ncbi:cytochrome C oxidase subunit III [Bacillus nitratireducens]|uniref:cytochrome C oxidase subunit III n=1 Tax=Bacillus nitratireducens TaxID=2026193 RepID=UPI001BABDD6F|nr:cytochrome C oxidase subunit III [Bacillus nitratireducens]QUG83067.1 cytochrome C oxidase subunit III [Bacillus nitratireducens]